MTSVLNWTLRVAAGHRRALLAIAVGLAAYPLLPRSLGAEARAVIAWDTGGLLLLVLVAGLFIRAGTDQQMAANARRQEDGEWTMFGVTLAGVGFSFVALVGVFAGAKDMAPVARGLHVALVGSTLVISWLVTHVIFTLRYAHEYYTRSENSLKPDGAVDGGLEFPGETVPDYWDFLYFALVLGMTFQVSDVQITSRKLRRLATAHGLAGFMFNTVIVALTVNIMAGLL